MTEETNAPSRSDIKKENFLSMLTKGNTPWIALGVVAVIAIVAALFLTGVIGGKVAATVNGEKVYLSEVTKQYDAYVNQYKTANQQPPNAQQAKNIKALILDRLIRDLLVKQAAEKENVTVSQADIDKGVKQIKDSTSPANLDKGLKQMGWTMDDLAAQVKSQLIQTKLRQSVTKGTKLNDADAQKYYNENKKNYNLPDQVKVQIAKVTSKATADKMAAEAKANFDNAAKKYAKVGYQAQQLSKDQITAIYSKEMASAAFGLGNGQMTAVIKVQNGYAVAKVISKTSARQKSFKEVKQEILLMLKSQKEQESFDKFIEKFKKESKINILISELKLQQQTMPTAPTGTPSAPKK